MNKLKDEWYIFLTAVMFFSRIPVGNNLPFKNSYLNSSTRYFTVVGGIVGILSIAVLWSALQLFSLPVSIFFSMCASILITGAFHEDGFADFCDGFGGGLDKEKILTIMKDSRIGTYGSLGLILMIGGKFLFLTQISPHYIMQIIVIAHICSRAVPVFVIHFSNYVQEDTLSKSKPIGTRSSIASPIIALVTFCLSIYISYVFAGILLLVYAVMYVAYTWYIRKKIGGYTGDVLGALQQLCEIAFYITFIAYQNNIIA